MMQRYFIELSYKGTHYFGWQKQPNDISVQETIENCLSKLNSNTPVSIVGCGRTDSGVHAHHYVFHVDLPLIDDESKFLFKLNRMLPDDIALKSIRKVSDEEHARFSATSRTYRYYIHQNKDPFLSDRSLYVPNNLDFNVMNLASSSLLGKQDFTSLSKLHTDVKSNICTVTKAEWVLSENEIYFEITADRFLRNMVRATVGTLMDIGLKKMEPEQFKVILSEMDRQSASTSVPPQGLFLWRITYQ